MLETAFPAHLREDVRIVFEALGVEANPANTFEIVVRGETLQIPEHVNDHSSGFWPPRDFDLSTFSDRQQNIAWCVLSRSLNGFQRQSAIHKLLHANLPWTIPYVIAEIGGYVLEIIEDIHMALPELETSHLVEFLGANKSYLDLLRIRVKSTWETFYCNEIAAHDYVGFKLMDELDRIAVLYRQ